MNVLHVTDFEEIGGDMTLKDKKTTAVLFHTDDESSLKALDLWKSIAEHYRGVSICAVSINVEKMWFNFGPIKLRRDYPFILMFHNGDITSSCGGQFDRESLIQFLQCES